MNTGNPYQYQNDLGGYNSEINSIINRRAERLNVMRSGMEYKRASKVAELEDKSRGLESSAREFLEGGIGGGLGAKEMIQGFPNVKKGIASFKKSVKFVRNKYNQYKSNQQNQADDTANEEQPEETETTQTPVEEQEPPSQTSNLNSADREVDIFEGTGRDGANPSDYSRGEAGQRVRTKLDDEGNQETATEETPEETEAATDDVTGETSDITSNITKDVTDDVVDDTLKTIGTDLGESSVFDWLGPLGWVVGAGMAVAGVVEEVNKAQASERASEQANIARKQTINPSLPKPDFSGSYVAPVATSAY